MIEIWLVKFNYRLLLRGFVVKLKWVRLHWKILICKWTLIFFIYLILDWIRNINRNRLSHFIILLLALLILLWQRCGHRITFFECFKFVKLFDLRFSGFLNDSFNLSLSSNSYLRPLSNKKQPFGSTGEAFSKLYLQSI